MYPICELFMFKVAAFFSLLMQKYFASRLLLQNCCTLSLMSKKSLPTNIHQLNLFAMNISHYFHIHYPLIHYNINESFRERERERENERLIGSKKRKGKKEQT